MLDARTGEWSAELSRAAGVPARVLPEIVEAGTRLGEITGEIADETGLDPSTPVIATATHDTAAAVAIEGKAQISRSAARAGTETIGNKVVESYEP